MTVKLVKVEYNVHEESGRETVSRKILSKKLVFPDVRNKYVHIDRVSSGLEDYIKESEIVTINILWNEEEQSLDSSIIRAHPLQPWDKAFEKTKDGKSVKDIVRDERSDI